MIYAQLWDKPTMKKTEPSILGFLHRERCDGLKRCFFGTLNECDSHQGQPHFLKTSYRRQYSQRSRRGVVQLSPRTWFVSRHRHRLRPCRGTPCQRRCVWRWRQSGRCTKITGHRPPTPTSGCLHSRVQYQRLAGHCQVTLKDQEQERIQAHHSVQPAGS
jgi:hypothetical protein